MSNAGLASSAQRATSKKVDKPPLPDGWRMVRVDDIKGEGTAALATGPFGSSISAKFFQPIGVPVIRGGNLSERVGERLAEDGFVFVSEQKAEEFKRAIVRKGDLVFTCWGTIGQIGLIDERATYARYVISNKQMKLTPNASAASSLYLYYALSSPVVAHQFTANAIGSSVPGFNLGQLKEIVLPLPPLPEQQAIAAVLGSLDDKIEVNRKLARVLEGIARAVFTSWFVDFDPVRRAAAGQPTGLPPDLAALFPKRLVDSAIGEVPEGWRVGTIGEIANAARDGVDPGEIGAETPYIGLEHMPRRSIALDQWEHAGKVTSGKSRFRRGQILFGKLRPYFHKVGVAPVDGVCSTDIIVAEPRKACWVALALGHLSSDALVKYADGSSTGTRMPRTNWHDLAAFEIAIPPEPIAAQASAIIAPIVQRMEAGIHANRTLAGLRDTLLPKLISGELRIADAEKIVGRVI